MSERKPRVPRAPKGGDAAKKPHRKTPPAVADVGVAVMMGAPAAPPDDEPAPTGITMTMVPVEDAPAAKVKKPRARAPKAKPAATEPTMAERLDEIIAQLPGVSTDMLEPDVTDLRYDPALPVIPMPVKESLSGFSLEGDMDADDALALIRATQQRTEASVTDDALRLPVTDETGATLLPEDDETPTKQAPALRSTESLVAEYRAREPVSHVPAHTDVWCYNDGHPFSTRPVTIPIRRRLAAAGGGGAYETDPRLFCSPECAARQLFSDPLNHMQQWERYSLLNTVYRGLYNRNGDVRGHAIRLAPKRDILTCNGGTFSIEEYRALIADGKIQVELLTPPMISLNSGIDAKPIDYYDASQAAAADAADRPAGLKLKRAHPRPNKEGTLDFLMAMQAGAAPHS